ncbi:MAG: 6,7-dimethyl-8-ribityllumazine synthase [Bacteroidia bacterium]|nr:6,7-dimethyl-8-ribityllumazine synthase [Bacteroidia bacterium]
MATVLKNLSEFNNEIPTAGAHTFGIVVSEWNIEITGALLNGAVETLKDAGATDDQIRIIWVPGSFELPFGAQKLAGMEGHDIDAVICLGCVIQGETRHFDFICQACADGVTNVGLKFNKPVIFGVLTTDNLEQAQDRSGGKHGNKGVEAAVTALKMLKLNDLE